MVQETVHVVPQFQSVDDVIMMSCGYLHEAYKPLKRPVGVVLGERGGGRGGRERRERGKGEEERGRGGGRERRGEGSKGGHTKGTSSTSRSMANSWQLANSVTSWSSWPSVEMNV